MPETTASTNEMVAEQSPPSRWLKIRATLGAWGFMLPAGVLVIIFFFIPVIILFILSLTDLASSNFSSPWTFIGLANFTRMFSDQFFPKILGNTFLYVGLTLVFFNVGLALVLAILTTRVNRRAGFFFRVLWLLPRLTPSVIYILMWLRITAPRSIRHPQPTVGPVWCGVAPMDLHQSLAFCHYGEWLCRRLFWADFVRLGNRIYSQGLCHGGQSRWRFRVADHP